jgi:pimeloyl-ACP methyl ester carboxylesterase
MSEPPYFCRVATIPYRSSQVHYSYAGNGNEVLLCLHGYGETENSFHFLGKYLPAGFQMIAIDLPYHGQTQWNETTDFTVNDLAGIIDAILTARQLPGASLTLLGFSMGGRMSLSILQAIPQRIRQLILLAPDGLTVNAWYWLATQTHIGIRFFKYTMKHPGWFFGVLQLGQRLRLINPSVFKFTRHYVDDVNMRNQLFQRWSGLRKIKPDLNIIKKKISAHQIRVELVYGEYDRIIRHERGEKFRKGIESFCRLQVLKTGHQLLQEKNAALIAGLL